jgi:hypothetical protein
VDDAQVHAVGGAIAEERPALAARDGAIATGHGDRSPPQAVAHPAVGRVDLRELGRPPMSAATARATRPRAERRCAGPARPGPAAGVDLRAQLAAHGQVAGQRRQRDASRPRPGRT